MRLFDWAHRVDLASELQEVYLHRFLFTLAVNTVAIFLPLYVYQQAGTAAPVFVFFAAYYGIFIVLVLPIAHLTARIGYKHTSLLSSPFILAFYLLLRTSTSLTTTFVAALIGGIGFITYWMGMNAEMARNSHTGHRAQEAGIFFSMPKLAAIISPIMGGMILAIAGFHTLFGVAALLVTLSYAPFLFSTEHYEGMNVPLRAVFSSRYLHDFATYAFRGMAGLYGKVVWPLYIAVVIGGSLNIGGAGTIMSFGGVIAGIGIGRAVARTSRTTVMLIGGLVTAVTYIASAYALTPTTAFIISFINGVSFLGITIPLYSTVMDRATKADIIEYFAFREVALCTGRVTFLAALFLVFTRLNLHAAFLTGFVILSGAAILAAHLGSHIPEPV